MGSGRSVFHLDGEFDILAFGEDLFSVGELHFNRDALFAVNTVSSRFHHLFSCVEDLNFSDEGPSGELLRRHFHSVLPRNKFQGHSDRSLHITEHVPVNDLCIAGEGF